MQPRGMEYGSPDALIQEIAARQHGVVARAQLLEAGVSPGAIDHRRKNRTLRPVHRSVYRVGPIAGPYQREMAAVLACAPDGVIGLRTAAGIFGIIAPPGPTEPVDVVGPTSLRGPATGVRVHRRRVPDPDEILRRHGIPLTAPARTLLDLASSLGSSELERAFARALRSGLVDVDSMAATLERHPRRPGCRDLRALVEHAAGPAFTRSEAEARFFDLLRRGGVPRPRLNALVHGLEVDFYWPDREVVVEIDGFSYHSDRSSFENDRHRDALLAAHGIVVVRFTWRQIQSEPEKTLVRLAMALGARTPGTRPGRRSAGAARI